MKPSNQDPTKPAAWRWKAGAILRLLKYGGRYDQRRAFIQRELAQAYEAGVWKGRG